MSRTVQRLVVVGGFELHDVAYSPGATVPWHCHELGEFTFLRRGALIEEIGGTVVRYSDGQVSYKPAGVPHRVQVSPNGAACIVIGVPSSQCAGFESEARRLAGPAVYSDPRFRDLFIEVFRQLQSIDESDMRLEAVALEIVGRVSGIRRIDRQVRAPEWMRPVIERLHDDWARRPALKELAELAGVAPAQLTRAFQRYYGCCVGEYFRRLQVVHARQMLSLRDRPLTEVAHQCGFYDQSHFTNIFRRYVGSTPAHFRRTLLAS